MLRCLFSFYVLNNNMLVQLKIVIKKLLLYVTEKQLNDLSYPIVLLIVNAVIYIDNRFCNLALLTWRLYHSSLDSCHASFHILNVFGDFHRMGLMFILTLLEYNLEFNINGVN